MRFLLVHGACHGAWCWELTIPELEALGHEAVAIDMPGHGERHAETSTLAGNCDAVVDAMKPGDVLVGHSMGCAIASLAADARPDLVQHIVLLSGPLPVEGKGLSYQSTTPTAGGEVGAVEENEDVVQQHMKVTEAGDAFYFDPEGATDSFFNDCSVDVAGWACSQLVPEPLGPINEPISIPRFWEANLPRSYIYGLRDHAWAPRLSRMQAHRLGVEPFTIDASHSPFLSRPRELAALLVEAPNRQPIGPLISGE
jgi:pimeloyl-ACP methyl ester carboxylesterase